MTDRELDHLWRRLDETLGPGPAATFRHLLPSVAWREAFPPDTWLRQDVIEAIDGPARREVHVALSRLLGDDAAATLMELLPPVPWGAMEALGLSPWRHLRPGEAA